MAILIRVTRPEDTAVVRRVDEEAFATVRSVYRPNSAALANLSVIEQNLQRLVAEEDGQVVATVRFGVFDGLLRVIGLGVLPQFRRQGVARALVEELLRMAKDHGCRALALYTVTETGNVLVFERLGFHLVSEQPDAYSISANGEPLTEAYMERIVA